GQGGCSHRRNSTLDRLEWDPAPGVPSGLIEACHVPKAYRTGWNPPKGSARLCTEGDRRIRPAFGRRPLPASDPLDDLASPTTIRAGLALQPAAPLALRADALAGARSAGGGVVA